MQITPHFKLSEFNCHDKAKTPYPEEWIETRLKPLCEALEKIREKTGKPLVVTSGYRTLEHNKAVGGVSKSPHLSGIAADIVCKGFTGDELAHIALELIKENKIPNGGLGVYPNRIHYDIRSGSARWRGKK